MTTIIATTLKELRDTLNALRDTLSHDEYSNLEVCNLPTFGGDEPRDTHGIYSWDSRSVLVCDHGEWTIESRDDLETVREYLARHDLRSNNREYLDRMVVRVTENPDHVRIWVSDSVCVWAVPKTQNN